MIVTAIYAALCGILTIVLSARVVFFRRAHKVGIGLADNKDLERRVRVHANAIENIPIALILLACFESTGGPAWAVHAFGAVLMLSRILHAYGLNKTVRPTFGRVWGTLGTWLVILGLAIALLVQALVSHI
jgi:uncharacterized protein